MPKMIVLVGASASGKTEIAKRLGSLYGVKKAVTHTSRFPRVNEVNHVDYHFVGRDEFLKLKEEDAFVETTCYNNNYYGCSKAEIGKDKVVVVDPVGLASFMALGDNSVISFFLTCDEQIRYERMRLRGDSDSSIAQRIDNDRVDFSNPILKKADFSIDTSHKDLDTLAKTVYRLYTEEYEKRKLD
ncbi:MAG: guanylate kinase, partial [Bacilli bacterium]|nr:guanylate kinase [Bacilli bacterium]